MPRPASSRPPVSVTSSLVVPVVTALGFGLALGLSGCTSRGFNTAPKSSGAAGAVDDTAVRVAALKKEIRDYAEARTSDVAGRAAQRKDLDTLIRKLASVAPARTADEAAKLTLGSWREIWSDESNPTPPGIEQDRTQTYQVVTSDGYGVNMGVRRGPFGPGGATASAAFFIRFEPKALASGETEVTFTNTYSRPSPLAAGENLASLAKGVVDGTAPGVTERQEGKFPRGPIGAVGRLRTIFVDDSLRLVAGPNVFDPTKDDLFVLVRTDVAERGRTADIADAKARLVDAIEAARAAGKAPADARPDVDALVAELASKAPKTSALDRARLTTGYWREIYSDEENPQPPGVTQVREKTFQVLYPDGAGYNFGVRKGPFGPPGTTAEATFVIELKASTNADDSTRVEFTKTYFSPTPLADADAFVAAAEALRGGKGDTVGLKESQGGAFPRGPIGAVGTLRTLYVDADFRVVAGPNVYKPTRTDLFVLTRIPGTPQ